VLILRALEHPGQFLALITALVVGLSVHEFAHAWAALRLGDATAYRSGRLTLDPRKHIDPLGALVFLVAGFGWARPVPVDGYRLGRGGMLRVALAGPLSNVLLATGAAMLVRFGFLGGWQAGGGPAAFLLSFLVFFTLLNLALAVFNMLPVAPLDGWSVLLGVVPPGVAYRLQGVERYGALVLLALLVLGSVGGTSVLGMLIWLPANAMATLLLGPLPGQG
jgi:Zn-dependent protease